MLDRIVSSASLVLCLLSDFWPASPTTTTTTASARVTSADWFYLFARAASGRALLYHLTYALLLNTVYGLHVLLNLTLGVLLANYAFERFLRRPACGTVSEKGQFEAEKRKVSLTENGAEKPPSEKAGAKKKKTSNGITSGKEINKGAEGEKKDKFPVQRRRQILQDLAIFMSSLSFLWAYTGSLLTSFVISLIAVSLIRNKSAEKRELFLMACYLFGTASPSYLKNLHIFNFLGGSLIFYVYYLDRH